MQQKHEPEILSTGFGPRRYPVSQGIPSGVQPGTVCLWAFSLYQVLQRYFSDCWVVHDDQHKGEHPSFHYDWNSGVALFSLLHPTPKFMWPAHSEVKQTETLDFGAERKFYCKSQARTMDGSCSKELNSPMVFSEEFLKANFVGGLQSMGPSSDWLIGEVTGWVWEAGISLPRIYMLMLSPKVAASTWMGAFVPIEELSNMFETLLFIPRGRSTASALWLHYCFLTAFPLSLGSLTSLISSCLSLPLELRKGLQTKNGKHRKVSIGTCLFSSPLFLHIPQSWGKTGNGTSFR